MDQQVLNQLDKIEAAAEKIVNDARGRKDELLKANEHRMAEFDQKADAEADQKIAALRETLRKQHQAENDVLMKNTEKVNQHLETVYRRNKDQIADAIVKEILQ